MSTIYSWNSDFTADTTGAIGDYTIVYDTSAGRTKKVQLNRLGYITPGAFYGGTKVAAQTFTATALTALATATISAANAAGVWGFSSSTVALTYTKRMSQIQANLETLMGKIDSTGLVNISGL